MPVHWREVRAYSSSVASQQIKVLIVDDHAVVRRGTRQLIEACADMVVVGEVERGDAVLEEVSRAYPDVVVLDLQLPGMSGIEVTRRLARESQAVKILILTAFAEEALLVEVLEAGAAGFLSKTVPGAELVEAVRAVYSGANVIDGALAGALVRMGRGVGRSANGSQGITPREREVLVLVAQGLANKVVAAELGISRRTVEGHLRHLFEKLGVSSRSGLVRYALRHHALAEITEGDGADAFGPLRGQRGFSVGAHVAR